MKFITLLCLVFTSFSLAAKPRIPYRKAQPDLKIGKYNGVKSSILSEFSQKGLTKNQLNALKKKTLAQGPAAVPSLITIMKDKKYPDRNKWVATFLLGKIVGKKSAPFISKFIQHPNWVMRMASLKTLNALKAKKYDGLYAYALKDKSMIVRSQALENIRSMNLVNMGSAVWAMLYDKQNYYIPKKKKGKSKRTHLIKRVIRTVGDLKFQKAKNALLAMIQKKKYNDIFSDMDYALTKITGKKSPSGRDILKKQFWKRVKMKETTI